MLSEAEAFLEDRRKVNSVLRIIKSLEENSVCTENIIAVEKIFTALLSRNEFVIDERLKAKDNEEWEVECEYLSWLKSSYELCVTNLTKLLHHTDNQTSIQTLKTLMNFVDYEGKHSIHTDTAEHLTSVKNIMKIVICAILSESNKTQHLLQQFKEYTAYPDINMHCWSILQVHLSNKQPYSEIFIHNLINFMDNLGAELTGLKRANFEVKELFLQADKHNFMFDYKLVQTNLKKICISILKQTHSQNIHRGLLVLILERLFQHFSNPLFLTDFFINSTNIGGATSLLALQGVLLLVQKHNMEYPNIYLKLYNMFEPKIFYAKYKARLFYLADIFLSSSHLQEQLVAAFAKRISRLCLTARTEDVKIMIMFVGNLLLRHPNLRKLIQHPTGGEVQNDPFLMEEIDPMKSRAVDSSLWELHLLKNHVQPSISTAAKFIDQNLPTVEWDMSSCLDDTLDQLFESEMKKKQNEIPLNFIRPQSIAKMSDDRLFKLWELT